MGTASFSFDPPSVPLSRPAAVIGVVKYVPISQINPDSPFLVMPNVVCEEVQLREGADPGSARFRYILNDSDPGLPWPDGFEDLYPIGATGRYVVKNDDRILVFAFGADGSRTMVFSGFAQVPEVSLSPEAQSVTFQAIGQAVRLWDAPIPGAVYQSSESPIVFGEFDETDLPVQFNPNGPDGKPRFNACPEDCEIPVSDDLGEARKYPIFIDPDEVERDSSHGRPWTLGMAIRYLLWQGNKDEEFVFNGDTSQLDALFQSLKPTDGVSYDPRDPSTFTKSDIIVRDFDASNRPAIDSIEALCNSEGFRVQFSTFANGANDDPDTPEGSPSVRINFTRRDGAFGQAPKRLNLQADGSQLDPGLSNTRDLHIARDLAGVFNQVRLETDPVRYEVSVVLACGFEPDTADIATAARANFRRSNWQSDTTQDDRNKYRRYIFADTGESTYSFATRGLRDAQGPTDLSNVLLGDDGKIGGKGNDRVYSIRFRPGSNTLISVGADKKPLRAQLAISRDYSGKYPDVWDGSGTWQPIPGGWELLKDELGIYVNVEDPEEWDVGNWTAPAGKIKQVASKTLRGITSQSQTAGIVALRNVVGNFWLRLTTVIDGDFGINAVAKKRAASPTKYTVERKLDCRDHYRKEAVHPSSAFYDVEAVPQDDNAFTLVRDDTKKSQAYAEAIRAANEFGPTAGSVTIPRFVNNYSIGDRISGIRGRDVSFQINATSGTNEGPQYPTVSAIRYSFGAKQETILMLSDRRAEPRESW